MNQRTIPYASLTTRTALAVKLGVIFTRKNQDWEWEIAEPKLIIPALRLYENANSDEERWSLMQIIIASFHEAQMIDSTVEINKLLPLWAEVLSLLREDYAIHWETIRYWAKFAELENSPIPMQFDLQMLQKELG